MSWLAEDPLPIWLVGALLLTAALVVYLQLRSIWSLWIIAGVVVLVVGLTLVEQFWITPREAVAQTLEEVLAAVEADDLPTTLSYLSQFAVDVRSDAETLMPRLVIERARAIDTPKITVNGEDATVEFRALFKARDRQSGHDGGYMDDVTVGFVHEDERWLIRDVRPAKPWRGRTRELKEIDLP
jgi:hypothetical protein